MQLTTWTIYQGKNLRNIENKTLLNGPFPFLVIRPDLTHGNEILGLAIEGDVVAPQVTDLLNRPLKPKQLIEIFHDKMGLVKVKDINEYQLKEKNLSRAPILEKNISHLIETYNILIKADPITFNTEDYDTDEKVKSNQNIFLEINFEKMPTRQLLNAINSGMLDFYQRLKELRNEQLTEMQRQEKILAMSGLQTNLILFFEQTLKRMDHLIVEQGEKIKKLEAELKEAKK